MFAQFSATEFEPRTRATHSHHVAKLSNKDLAPTVTTTYGINRDSILNTLAYFHVTEGLPPDIMHDILEGVLQYEVKEMLLVFTRDKSYFTLDALNKMIAEFNYHFADSKNKPSQITIKADNKLNQEGTYKKNNTITVFLYNTLSK